MRIAAALLAVSVLLSAPAFTASDRTAKGSHSTPTQDCQRTTIYKADGNKTGQLRPRKLTDLPPASTYMAVWRHIDGCVAPLTMADYRKQPLR